MTDRLALSGVVGFGLGIFGSSLLVASLPFAGFLALLGCIGIGAFRIAPRRIYAILGVFLVCSALGVARVSLAPLQLPEEFHPLIGSSVEFVGKVVAAPDIRETHQRITLEVEGENASTRILVTTERYPEIAYGDVLQVSGKLELPEPFETNGGRVFRYDKFLAKEGIFAVLPFASIEKSSSEGGVLATLFSLKPAFLGALSNALPEPQASLAGGLIAGGKEGLGDELLDMFIITGLIHIVVLSGYNVMIIAQMVMSLFSRAPRRIAAFSAGATILFFVLAAGAGAASIRAGLMALVALFAQATGRTYDALRALLLIGVIMLLHNPLLLAFDPGFGLSFVATLGLIIGTPLVEQWFSRIKWQPLREIASATLAAQIAVLPLLLYETGVLSLVAFPANLLVLPAVPLAMAFSALAALGGFLGGTLAPFIGLPAFSFLSYITFVTESAARIPLAAVTLPAFPFVFVVFAYALLGLLVFRLSASLPELSRNAFRRRPS